VGILLKKAARKKSILELRDLAVSNGAKGALIFHHEKELGLAASNINFLTEYAKSYQELKKTFKINKGNSLLVTFSDTHHTALNAALAVAVEMNKNLKKIYTTHF